MGAGGEAMRDLETAMERQGMAPEVRARLRRLNPNYQEGDLIRGWHPAWQAKRLFWLDIVPKSKFIRAHGREAWQALPPGAIRKNGKRCYIERRVVEDRLWMLPTNHPGRS